MIDVENEVKRIVERILRRNGGAVEDLDFDQPMLGSKQRIDSLDLAEVIATLEDRTGLSLDEGHDFPRTWRELVVAFRSLEPRAAAREGDQAE